MKKQFVVTGINVSTLIPVSISFEAKESEIRGNATQAVWSYITKKCIADKKRDIKIGNIAVWGRVGYRWAIVLPGDKGCLSRGSIGTDIEYGDREKILTAEEGGRLEPVIIARERERNKGVKRLALSAEDSIEKLLSM